MKLWVDDLRPAPDGYDWFKSVNEAKEMILESENIIDEFYQKKSSIENPPNWNDYQIKDRYTIELIDIDHDAGDYASDGGDYINLLNWLEETNRSYPIRIHSMNPVGVQNMRRIIKRNGWTEVK